MVTKRGDRFHRHSIGGAAQHLVESRQDLAVRCGFRLSENGMDEAGEKLMVMPLARCPALDQHPGKALFSPLPLLEQARFANSGLADDDRESAFAGACRGARFPQLAELVAPPAEGRLKPCWERHGRCRRPCNPFNLISRPLWLPTLLPGKVCREQSLRRRRDADASRLCSRLEPGREADRFTEQRVVDAAGRDPFPKDDRSGVDSGAEPDCRLRALLRSKFGDRCDLVCRLDGSPWIIFAGHRCAEESDDLIPNYADYFSIKVADHPCHTVDRFAERFDGHLGVGRRLCR